MNIVDTTSLTFKQESLELLTGGISYAVFFVGAIFAVAGMIIRKYLGYRFRQKGAAYANKGFNIRYFIRHNWVDMLFAFVIILLLIRFYAEIIVRYFPDHVDDWGSIDMFICFLIGLSFQDVVKRIYNKITSKSWSKKIEEYKKISWVVRSDKDFVVYVDGDKKDMPITELAIANQGYFLKKDVNDKIHLCFEVPVTIVTLTAKFKNSEGKTYMVISKDFVGDEPKA